MSDDNQFVLTANFFATHAKTIEKILQKAVNHALLTHKRLENPVAVWEDGKVVIIPPEKIVLRTDVDQAE